MSKLNRKHRLNFHADTALYQGLAESAKQNDRSVAEEVRTRLRQSLRAENRVYEYRVACHSIRSEDTLRGWLDFLSQSGWEYVDSYQKPGIDGLVVIYRREKDRCDDNSR